MTSEEQELARRKIYQAMINQGMTPDTQQIVSGRVVPYSPIQGLSKLGQAYLGRRGLDKLDTQATERQGLEQGAIVDYLKTAQGTPAAQPPGMDLSSLEPSALADLGAVPGDPNKAMQQYAANPNARQAILDALIAKQMGITGSNASAYTRSQYENRNGVIGLATYDGRTGKEISFDPGRAPLAQDVENRGNIKQREAEAVIAPSIEKAGGIAQAQADVELATKPGIQQAVKSAEEVGKAEGAAKVELPSVEGSATETVDLVDQLISHPGLKDVVGLPDNPLSLKGYMPGTNAADFKSRMDQLTGRTFLEIFPTLKGGGQITEIEGAKGQAAINRMSTATSEKDFIQAANDFKAEINRLRNIVRGRAGAAPSEAQTKKRLKYNRETGMME